MSVSNLSRHASCFLASLPAASRHRFAAVHTGAIRLAWTPSCTSTQGRVHGFLSNTSCVTLPVRRPDLRSSSHSVLPYGPPEVPHFLSHGSRLGGFCGSGLFSPPFGGLPSKHWGNTGIRLKSCPKRDSLLLLTPASEA